MPSVPRQVGASIARRFSTDFDRIASEVRRALPQGAEVCIRKKLGLIAWKNLSQLRFVYLLQLNRVIYRFSLSRGPIQNNLPDQIVGTIDLNHGQRYPAQLNFHYSETFLIKGTDLVRFTEDCFRFFAQPKYIYPWPLFFASGRWQPRMAWTELAQRAQRKLSPEEQLLRQVQLPTPQSKQKFTLEPKTKKQEYRNDKILCGLLEREKGSRSPAASKQYRKLRSGLRRAIQASGYSEEEVVSAIVERWPSQ
ncbi:MAG: hypothetical protein WB586_30405, partial [Chthoniobacterales bacterium]